jgi:hypothetical protein
LKIEFIANQPFIDPPVPASKVLPQWYKDHDSYIGHPGAPMGNGKPGSTIKKCMPVFDSLSAGYILSTYTDIYVTRTDDGEPIYEWSSLGAIDSHDIRQVSGYPAFKSNEIPFKLMSYWGIKTPKKYSCLFVPPMHRESPFKILPGIVDTDTYHSPVNFTFQLIDSNFEGLIPVGTPFAQIIPFKRDDWSSQVIEDYDRKHDRNIMVKLQQRFHNAYKDLYWEKKTYK